MKLDRSVTPNILPIQSFNIVKAEKFQLSELTPLYAIHSPSVAMTKIEWIFAAGNWNQKSPMVAFAVNSMLIEGTTTRSSLQIAESIEYYGAHLGFNVDKDNAFVSLTCQTKYLPDVLPVIYDLLTNASFPEHELSIFRNKHRQNFLVEMSKVRSVARFAHSRMLFGTNHPYGQSAEVEDFDRLNRESMLEFYKTYYQLDNCKIVASGNVSDDVIALLGQYFAAQTESKRPETLLPTLEPSADKKQYIEKHDAVQCALRIGKVMFTKLDPDYNGLTVLNCILGGYFGSRLMKKIREEKGYTYGINSLLVSFKYSGFLTIVSETGADVTRDAVNDIYAELELLRREAVSEEELNRVKNYMLGEVVRMFDGPFAQAESLISLLEYELDYSYFDQMIHTIKTISADEIQQLAIKYLDPSSFSEVVVGQMK